MAKYVNFKDFVTGATSKYTKKTTADRYMEGVAKILPPNYSPSNALAKRYESETNKDAAVNMIAGWVVKETGGALTRVNAAELVRNALRGGE